ncbi:MAG: ABC transporter ATP-binding protein [Pirellulales bacterium]|nr:ABC transporter ATP-binding protein [Pirellulales bacterium]
MSAIVASGLAKWYGKTRALDDLDLEVHPGEVFGFLGPNGAGKTTTIRMLLDFIRPTHGRATVLGLDCRRHSTRIRRRVGYVPGEFTLYESLTGEQLLGFLASLRGGVDGRVIGDLARRLDSDLRRPIRELSHGNKQKICIIQALMSRPEVLLLDEPTTGLDPLVQQEFYRLVAEVRAEGRTVFFSSHILSEVERVCRRVAIIRQGRLLKVATVAELKAKALRRVTVTFAGPADGKLLAAVPQVRDAVAEGNRLCCVVQGSLDATIKALAAREVIDVISQEPSLEDVFLALYHEGADAA